MVGAALALVREGVWGLSLLVVRPEHQSHGLGRALLRARSPTPAAAAAAGSSSPRPTRGRCGPTRGRASTPTRCSTPPARARAERPPGVRDGAASDLPLTEAVDRAVRGAAHGGDIEAFLRAGTRLLVVPDRGYAVRPQGAFGCSPRSTRRRRATSLLAVLARAPPGDEPSRVDHQRASTGRSQPCSTRGCSCGRAGRCSLRGDVGPLRPTYRAARTSSGVGTVSRP